MAKTEQDQRVENRRALVKKLDGVGWGLFFIWIGIAFLGNVGWGVGILGVGVITLGSQLARKYFGLPVERFWLAIGIIFVLWSLWGLLKIQFGETPIPGGILPVLFIVIGIVLVVSAMMRKPQH